MSGRALLLVNFFSADLIEHAIRSARETSSEPLEVLVVDNSCSSEERRRLETLDADRLVFANENLGYGRGANLGMRASSAERITLANPDVRFAPGSLDILFSETERLDCIAGPKFFWDDGLRWMLPPAGRGTIAELLSETLASRSGVWRRFADRRRTLQRVRFWSDESSRDLRTLSGAVMTFRRASILDLGGFDSRYPLYFEEIDLQRRARAAGLRVRYVPAARCRHLYNQSAGRHPGAAAMYAESEREYFRRFYPAPLVNLAIAWRRPPAASPSLTMRSMAEPLDIPIEGSRVLVEASPLPDFQTAAGTFAEGPSVRIPEEILSAYRSSSLFVRTVDRETGRAGSVWGLSKND